jgi:hypothetical protein
MEEMDRTIVVGVFVFGIPGAIVPWLAGRFVETFYPKDARQRHRMQVRQGRMQKRMFFGHMPFGLGYGRFDRLWIRFVGIFFRVFAVLWGVVWILAFAREVLKLTR